MDRVYKGMNKVIICKTQYKRPLIKRTNEECLQLSWSALYIFKSKQMKSSIYKLSNDSQCKALHIFVYYVNDSINSHIN